MDYGTLWHWGKPFLSLGPVDELMTVEQQAMASLGMASFLGALALLALGMVAGLVRVTRYIRKQSPGIETVIESNKVTDYL